MAKAKMADEELSQLKQALRYLAEQWEELPGNMEPRFHAQTLLALLARIESLPANSPDRLIKAAVHDAKGDALGSQRES